MTDESSDGPHDSPLTKLSARDLPGRVATAYARLRQSSLFAKLSARDFLNPIAIIVSGLMISSAILSSNRLPPQLAEQVSKATAQQQEPAQPPAPPVDIANVNQKGEPFIGKADAPVVMAYWFDYQCPFCKRNEVTAFPKLIKDYVETGKVKIVYKDFQFLGPDSQTAGLAARAVWEVAPDKFGDWHKAMFDHQDGENTGWGNKDDIIAMTKTIPGIDSAKVEALMTSHAADFNKAMEADSAEGNAMGINGTPAAVIGKKMISGAVPYDAYKQAIDGALSPS